MSTTVEQTNTFISQIKENIVLNNVSRYDTVSRNLYGVNNIDTRILYAPVTSSTYYQSVSTIVSQSANISGGIVTYYVDGDFNGIISGSINGSLSSLSYRNINFNSFTGSINGSINGYFTGTLTGSFSGSIIGSENTTGSGFNYTGSNTDIIVPNLTYISSSFSNALINGFLSGVMTSSMSNTSINGSVNAQVSGLILSVSQYIQIGTGAPFFTGLINSNFAYSGSIGAINSMVSSSVYTVPFNPIATEYFYSNFQPILSFTTSPTSLSSGTFMANQVEYVRITNLDDTGHLLLNIVGAGGAGSYQMRLFPLSSVVFPNAVFNGTEYIYQIQARPLILNVNQLLEISETDYLIPSTPYPFTSPIDVEYLVAVIKS
jgi:hypothetical protein